MPYSIDDFLSFGPVFSKELTLFATTFAQAVQEGNHPVKVVEAFATHLKAYYGITRTHTYDHLGLLPLGFWGLEDGYQGRSFPSPEAEHDAIRQEARSIKATMEDLGFRYEKNTILPKCFLERQTLFTQYSEVRIAPAFLPMGSAIYVPGYVSLWVKK